MTALLIGNARCSTDEQDLTVQRKDPPRLGVTPDRIHVDHGLTGCNRERPGLRNADTGARRSWCRRLRSGPHHYRVGPDAQQPGSVDRSLLE